MKLEKIRIMDRETVPAQRVGGGLYQIRGVPLFFRTLNYGDVVQVSDSGLVLALKQRGGHRKSVLRFRDAVEEENLRTLMSGLQGVVVEKIFGFSDRFLGAMVVSHPHPYDAVKNLFRELQPDVVVTDGRELGMLDTFQKTRKFGELGPELQRRIP